MDEENYRIIRTKVAPVPCAFEKSILALRVCCTHASKINLAEREIVHCASVDHQLCCKEWLQQLRIKSQFSLRLTDVNVEQNTLPHGKEMKVQVGGINGLASLLEQADPHLFIQKDALHDVSFILTACSDRFGSVDKYPFGQIVKFVTAFRLRHP